VSDDMFPGRTAVLAAKAGASQRLALAPGTADAAEPYAELSRLDAAAARVVDRLLTLGIDYGPRIDQGSGRWSSWSTWRTPSTRCRPDVSEAGGAQAAPPRGLTRPRATRRLQLGAA
jgi:hypothetical protein